MPPNPRNTRAIARGRAADENVGPSVDRPDELYAREKMSEDAAKASSRARVHNLPFRPAKEEAKPVPAKSKLSHVPPPIIEDTRHNTRYFTGPLLGEGGFARCFQVRDPNGKLLAAKVVAKQSLKNAKQRSKLVGEIQIHREMRHANIVHFISAFEDDEHVYIILELCENRSLAEMLKRKKQFSEEEARFYMLQLFGAIRYMHDRNIIHRDLKLGNLFLNSNMDVKIGDYGLATKLEGEQDRKKTICGTPNYIAPEVLFDTQNGHSYEVDLWSLGVIMYTMLIGKPPFQTKDVKAIYKRIKENNYEFPDSNPISLEAKDLISALLSSRPEHRPSIAQVLAHDWFKGETKRIGLDWAPEKVPDVAPTQPEVRYVPTEVESAANRFSGMILTQKTAPTSTASPGGNRSQRAMGFINEPNRASPRASKPLPSSNPVRTAISFASSQASPRASRTRPTLFETVCENILQALSEDSGRSRTRLSQPPPASQIFVNKWIDYSHKYGLGYLLTNGCVGVYFNDSSSIILSADESQFEYLFYGKAQADRVVMNRQRHTMEDYPDVLNKKVTLLKHFRSYIYDNLCKHMPSYAYVDLDKTSNLDFLTKYVRTKEGVVFRLSNRVVQINFSDHSKLVLSDEARHITFINANKELISTWLQDVYRYQELREKLVVAVEILSGVMTK